MLAPQLLMMFYVLLMCSALLPAPLPPHTTPPPTCISLAAAETFNLGGTANLYDVIDTSSLTTVAGQLTGVQSLVRLSPAGSAPPTQAPGVTLSGSKTFTYNIIVSRLLTCTSDRTVRAAHTWWPSDGGGMHGRAQPLLLRTKIAPSRFI